MSEISLNVSTPQTILLTASSPVAVGPTGPKGDKGDIGLPNSLSIGTVTSGTAAAAVITGTAPSQTLSLVLPAGEPARQAEFRSNLTHLQWRLVGDTEWNNLTTLSAITGPAGQPGSGTKIGTVIALS